MFKGPSSDSTAICIWDPYLAANGHMNGTHTTVEYPTTMICARGSTATFHLVWKPYKTERRSGIRLSGEASTLLALGGTVVQSDTHVI